MDTSLSAMVSRSWWALALRGVLAILFGIAAFAWPSLTLALLVSLFAAFALVDGIMALAAGIQARWWSLVFFGILGIAAGVLTFFWPGVTALSLLVIIAWWAIFRGVMEIWAAITLRKVIPNEWVLILGGVASIVFGGLVIAYPGAGALAVIWWIGAYALVIGVLALGLAIRVRRLVGGVSHAVAGQP
jgi:uncharacterized membrane protein HdeD (DUF308 family)